MNPYDEGYDYDPSYEKNFQQGDLVASTIAQNLNVNLSNIIEDVKKQRMDIIRLNNELKNSRVFMDKKNYDEARSRQELNQMFRQIKKESDHYQQQMVNLQQIILIKEESLKEKEEIIRELRMKNSDNQRTLSNKQAEIENLNLEVQRIRVQLENALAKSNVKERERELNLGMDQDRESYVEKYRMESKKSTTLQSQLNQKELRSKELEMENESLRTRLRMYEQETSIKDSKLSSVNQEQKYKQMLVYDYHLLNSILNNLDDTIKELN